MEKVDLIVEKAEDGILWGPITYEGNLLVDSADSLPKLEAQMRVLLWDFHEVKNVAFEITYDLSTFFDLFSYLKISKVAEYAGLNAPAFYGTMWQGVKLHRKNR